MVFGRILNRRIIKDLIQNEAVHIRQYTQQRWYRFLNECMSTFRVNILEIRDSKGLQSIYKVKKRLFWMKLALIEDHILQYEHIKGYYFGNKRFQRLTKYIQSKQAPAELGVDATQ